MIVHYKYYIASINRLSSKGTFPCNHVLL